jgi:hypothetical protein
MVAADSWSFAFLRRLSFRAFFAARMSETSGESAPRSFASFFASEKTLRFFLTDSGLCPVSFAILALVLRGGSSERGRPFFGDSK